MIAVIYSDSHSADWKLAGKKNSQLYSFKTKGINPAVSDEKYIHNIFNKSNHLINYAEKVNRICFFGAGTFSKIQKGVIRKVFGDFFKNAKIVVDRDIKAAALATCGDQSGIVGILASGSNAAFFDGKKLRSNNLGLGHVLADEGSSNWLGRVLLKHYLNESLPLTLLERFKERFDLDRRQILDKVYRSADSVLFLSSFSDFLLENKSEGFVKKIVIEGFQEFFLTNILPLKKRHPHSPIHLVGTLAYNFGVWLHEVADSYGIHLCSIVKEPIDRVLDYYKAKNCP